MASNGTQGVQHQSGTVKGGRVPFVVSYRRITKRPVYKRIREFVGFRKVLLNLAIKALDFVEDVCFESGNEVVDPGEQSVVHWAVEIDDPWGVNNISHLAARKVLDKPGCGAHYEVIRIVDEKAEQAEAKRQAESDRSSAPELSPLVASAVRKPEQEKIRQRMRERLLQDGHFDPEAGPAKDD